MVEYLLDDVFSVKDVDPDGKKFDRVSRIVAKSENYEMDLTLDIHSDMYPMEVREKFALVLSPSLRLDGSTSSFGGGNTGLGSSQTRNDEITYADLATSKTSLADNYDYVMYGKIFKYENQSNSKISVYASFGGLLMSLEGDARHLSDISIGKNVFLLIRKL